MDFNMIKGELGGDCEEEQSGIQGVQEIVSRLNKATPPAKDPTLLAAASEIIQDLHGLVQYLRQAIDEREKIIYEFIIEEEPGRVGEEMEKLEEDGEDLQQKASAGKSRNHLGI